MRMDGKVALVTGGAGGLGAAVARRLAVEGARVVVTDLSAEAASRTAEAIGGTGLAHDVTSEDGWGDVVAEVSAQHGRIDALVHCAGIEGDREHGGLATDLAGWSKVMDVNLTSGFLAAKVVVPVMREQGEGSIVYLSSAVARLAARNGLAYGVSKAAVVALSRGVAALASEGGVKVRCNVVLPGPIRTAMTDRLFADLAAKRGLTLEQFEAEMTAAIPLGSRGVPEDIAEAILYLLSPEARYVTGTELVVDGGWTLQPEP